MADYQLKRAAQRRIDSAPELKAPPSWLEEAVASLRRGIGRGMVEGVPHSIGNIANMLRGLPEVPSEYDRRQGVMHEAIPTSTTEDIVGMIADPTNIIGGAMLKPAARAVRRALPTAATVGSAAYAGDTEAGPLQRLAARLGKEAAPNRRGIANVIKEKGGNWLSGSVEGALSGLKKRMDPDLAGDVARADPAPYALNNFIDKQLTRYIKNEMATPEDPVRALAERGVLHVEPEALNFRPEAHGKYLAEGQTAIAQNPLAKVWEGAADLNTAPVRAGDLLTGDSWLADLPVYRDPLKQNPWLAKVPPETNVYALSTEGGRSRIADDLGFNHLIDELSNALNPESGLPRHLLLDPKSIERVSVPQAVERVAKINEWRAAQKAEADAMRANNAVTVLHKEYPEKGMKWVELKAGDSPNPEMEIKRVVGKNGEYFTVGKPGEKYPHTTFTEQEAIRASNRQVLQDALKYEGDAMDHCVDGYCDNVVSGRSRIYSLRDAKGQPHVTIEVQPMKAGYLPEPSVDPSADIAPRILQIKGKQNRAPNPEYLPFVQDFVKSGQWSDVGDLQNTGLQDLRGFADEPMAKAAREKLGNYATREEWDAFANTYVDNKSRGYASGGSVQKFAKGGLARLASRLAADSAPSRRGVAEVVKEKGGNWLSGSVEGALSGLKKRMDPELEGYARRGQNLMPHEASDVLPKIAINNFIDKQLTKYVKNDMATPEDPLRLVAERWPEEKAKRLAAAQAKLDKLNAKTEKLMAERGVPEEFLTRHRQDVLAAEKAKALIEAQEGLHFSPQSMPRNMDKVWKKREELGFPSAYGSDPLAQKWEAYSDQIINAPKAEIYQNFDHSNMSGKPGWDWISKVAPETRVYGLNNPSSNFRANEEGYQSLGFGHLIDELSNALNPQSGLPKHLLLDPEHLGKVSVPQAVERVAQINAYRAAQKAEADAMRANNAATVLHKEYPEKGMKWVELRQPETLPEGWQQIKNPAGTRTAYYDPSGATIYDHPGQQALQDALKYEGDTMGHCVGGYCEDVASGRSRIYSLRDAKGQPHVTIEVAPERTRNANEWYAWQKQNPEEYAKLNAEFGEDMDAKLKAAAERYKEPPRILQIKGKQNRAPNPEYLPFVQDFVKSGQWSDVGDLQNAGLFRVQPGQKWPGFSEEMPAGYWSIEDAEKQAVEKGMDPEVLQSWLNRLRNPNRYASGGQVKNSLPDFTNPAIINAIFKELQHG